MARYTKYEGHIGFRSVSLSVRPAQMKRFGQASFIEAGVLIMMKLHTNDHQRIIV